MRHQDWHRLLQDKFGHQSFRGSQEEVLRRLDSGESILALMPTGMGKSLCYQMRAFTQPEGELVLVVSPLIALMQDQTQRALDLGLKASFINSSLSADEKQKRLQTLSEKKYELLFVTPERFRKEDFRKALSHVKVSLFVVDEAHCASLWGHDFRPDYARLKDAIELCGRPQVLALTATATVEVQKDICQILGLKFPDSIVKGGLERPELGLSVIETYSSEEKFEHIAEIIFKNKDVSGLVYFSLIQTLENFCRYILKKDTQKSIRWTKYHGDLPAAVRRQNQNDFLKGKIQWIFATPAFGLGVDKADTRFVLHAEIPSTLESYFQEVGRAGRDGHPAQGILFYDQDDVSIQMQFLDWAYPESEFIKKVYHLIEKNEQRVSIEGFDYLREQMVFKNKKDFRVHSAVSILHRWGCLEEVVTPFGYKAVGEPDESLFSQENQSLLKKEHQKKLLEMLRWAQDDKNCRLNKIYNYFGLNKNEDCGRCDVCQK